MNLYREKYASYGNETFTECCVPKDERSVIISYLNKLHTEQEK